MKAKDILKMLHDSFSIVSSWGVHNVREFDNEVIGFRVQGFFYSGPVIIGCWTDGDTGEEFLIVSTDDRVCKIIKPSELITHLDSIIERPANMTDAEYQAMVEAKYGKEQCEMLRGIKNVTFV